MNLYTFDRKLHLLVMDAIEPIETALRSQFIYHLSHTYDAFRYLNAKNFSPRFKHHEWLAHLDQLIADAYVGVSLGHRGTTERKKNPLLQGF